MRLLLGVAIVSLIFLTTPAIAEACGCAGPIPSSIAFQAADLVFTGTVVRLDGCIDANGQPVLEGVLEPLQVIALGGGRRIEMTASTSGSFQLVLPPGDYDVWVERAGHPVMSKQKVHESGVDHRQVLAVDFKD